MSTRILQIEGDRKRFLDLLMLADPEEAVVRAYPRPGTHLTILPLIENRP